MNEHTVSSQKHLLLCISFCLFFLLIVACETKPPTVSIDTPAPVGFAPDSSGSDRAFLSVWGLSGDDAWVGGMVGELRHLESGQWVKYESGVFGDINDIWGRAADDIYAVCSSSEIIHFNGTSWSEIETFNTSFLLSVWGDQDGRIYATGKQGLTMASRGSSWVEVAGNTPYTCRDIWGVTTKIHPAVDQKVKAVITVGNNGFSVRYDDSVWEMIPVLDIPFQLLAGVWGSSWQDIILVGRSGRIIRYNGSDWRDDVSPSAHFLNSIHGNRQGNVYVSGYRGTVLHNNGLTWQVIETGTLVDLKDIWVTPDNTVFVVGEKGTILRGSVPN